MTQEPDQPPTSGANPPDGQRPRGEGAERKPFLLRLSPEVLAELRGWAGQEFRSLNGHIEYLLRRAIEEHKRGKRRGGG